MLQRIQKIRIPLLICFFIGLIIYIGFLLLKNKNMQTTYDISSNQELVIDGVSLKVVRITDLKIINSDSICCQEAEVIGFPLSNPKALSSENLLKGYSFRVGDNVFYVNDIAPEKIVLEYVKLPVDPMTSVVFRVEDKDYEYVLAISHDQYPLYSLSASDKRTKKNLWQRQFSTNFLSMALVNDGLLLKNQSHLSILDLQTGSVVKDYFAPSETKLPDSDYVHKNWQMQRDAIESKVPDLSPAQRKAMVTVFADSFIPSTLSGEHMYDYGVEYTYLNSINNFTLLLSIDGSLYIKSSGVPMDFI